MSWPAAFVAWLVVGAVVVLLRPVWRWKEFGNAVGKAFANFADDLEWQLTPSAISFLAAAVVAFVSVIALFRVLALASVWPLVVIGRNWRKGGK